MNKQEKNQTVKWIMLASFIVLLIGGLNYLLMGLFTFDMFGSIFGYESLGGRLIFSLFGLSAVILTLAILIRIYNKSETNVAKTRSRS